MDANSQYARGRQKVTPAPWQASSRRASPAGSILAGFFILGIGLCAAVPAWGDEKIVRVTTQASLNQALSQAKPGTRIQIAEGRYRAGIRGTGVRGTKEQPITIEGLDLNSPPLFAGGNEGWHLTDCAHLTLRNIAVSGQRHNGINIDDGGTYETPSHHIVLENIRVNDVGPEGNCDAIKLSGVDDFVVRNCRIDGWGGQAIDMVGCHRGLIENCELRGKEGFAQATGLQTKGGSRDIIIRRCRLYDAGARGVNLGGSTGRQFFRPLDANYEARNIAVEGCVFVGSEVPVAFVGVDGATVRYNTIYHPGKWVFRILQETTADGFLPCRHGRFQRNLIVFRASDVRTAGNIGPHTQPASFTFDDNYWYCEDRPAASRPSLPVKETGGVYGDDPQLKSARDQDFTPQAKTAAAYGASAFKPDSAAQ